MDFQLVTTHIKNHWRLKLEKLFSKPCDIDLIKESQDNNSWLYFRRTNPRKFEIYIDEGFELKGSQNVMSDQINKPNFLPNEIKVHPDDLLCINVEGTGPILCDLRKNGSKILKWIRSYGIIIW